jgi:hypothetical protein
MSSLKSTLIKSFSEANGCDPENVKNFAKIYLTPTVSSDASLLVVKDTSTDASGNATYQYIISPSDSSMQTKNGVSFLEFNKSESINTSVYQKSFSYSAIINYNFDTFEEMRLHTTADNYCRFPYKSIDGGDGFTGYYDYGAAIQFIADEWYEYGDANSTINAARTCSINATYFTDTFKDSSTYFDVTFDFYIICDDPSAYSYSIQINGDLIYSSQCDFKQISERTTPHVGKTGQYYSKLNKTLKGQFTTYDLYSEIIDDHSDDNTFGKIRNTAVGDFYKFAFEKNDFKIPNYICSQDCCDKVDTHDIEHKVEKDNEGLELGRDWQNTTWAFYKCPDPALYDENYGGSNSDYIYYNGYDSYVAVSDADNIKYKNVMNYGVFLPGASYSKYEDFYDSSSYESALKTALLPILIKGEEVEESGDDEESSNDSNKYIGLHMFNRTFLKKDIINVTVYCNNNNVFSNVYFYIDNVQFKKSAEPPITSVELYGSTKSYSGSDIGYVSDINTYAFLKDLCNYYGLCTSFNHSAINITPTTENFNKGLLGAQETINPYVQFNITSAAPPKVSYIKNSLMIDGFDINDFNGYINNVLDSRYHDICVKFKNEEKNDIIVTPELFNVVYTYKENGVHQGNFMNLYDEYARDPNNQVNISNGILQFPMKTYTRYISSGDPSTLYDYVLIKLNSENFSGVSSLYEPENDVSIFAQIEPPRRVMPPIKIMTDTGSYAAKRVTAYCDNNGREYWIIPAGTTAEIHYTIVNNKSTVARLFGIGLTMMFKQAISYEYAKQYIITFNDRKMKDSDDNDVNLPIFIQTVNMTNTQEAKYLTTNNLDESDNVINIGEEITNSDDNADNMIIDIRNCEIIMVPHRFTAPNDSNMSNPEDSNPANERCLTANNLIINLPATAHSQYGYYKYVEHDNEYAAKWKAITTTIITPTIDV